MVATVIGIIVKFGPSICFVINIFVFLQKTEIDPRGIIVNADNGIYLFTAVIWLMCIFAQLLKAMLTAK